MGYLEPIPFRNGSYDMTFRKTGQEKTIDVHHAHRGVEFLYVHEGEGLLLTGTETIQIKGGTLLVISPFSLHHLILQNGSEPFVRTVFLVDPSAMDELLSRFPKLNAAQHRFRDESGIRVVPDIKEAAVNPLFESVVRRSDENPFAHDADESAGILYLVLLMLSLSRTEPALNAARYADPGMKRIVDWIDAQYCSGFTTAQLAEAVHLSRGHVTQRFRKGIGITITEYVNAKRITQASMLLRTSSDSVRKIAEQVGLRSNSYFCSLFKQKTGYSPYQYRKMYWNQKNGS